MAIITLCYLYGSYQTVEAIVFEAHLSECVSKFGEPWLCTCPLADMVTDEFGNEATEACIDYCYLNDQFGRCKLHSMSETYDKTNNAAAADLHFCGQDLTSIELAGSFAHIPKGLDERNDFETPKQYPFSFLLFHHYVCFRVYLSLN